MSVGDLTFDPQNPRFPSEKIGAQDKDVFQYMLENVNLVDLLLSIATQGYFPGEPLLATPSTTKPGKYEVLEGNRRLAALILLLSPELAPIKKDTVKKIADEARFKPKEVPVLIYDSRQEVLQYLGYRHITGVAQWDSLAKARYLAHLRDQYKNLDYVSATKELAKIIGSRSDYVHRLLSGFQIYKKIEENNFFKIPDLKEENFKFSVLTTALSYKNINNYVTPTDIEESVEEIKTINIGHLKDLTEWMFKEFEGRTRLGESRNLKTLNAIISAPRAFKAFKDNGRPLEEAKFLTNEPKEIFSSAIQQALDRILDAKLQSHQVETPSNIDLENLKEMVQVARELYQIVKSKITLTEEV